MSPRATAKAEPRKKTTRAPARARAGGGRGERTNGRGDGVRAWVATADMGLGHQRAAYPLRNIAEEGLLTLGRAGGNSDGEHKLWQRLRKSYEFLSRTKSWPVIGGAVFGLLDRLQNIPPFYPMRDLSSPTFQVSWLKGLINKGMCASLLTLMKNKPLPLVTTFYAPAIAADMAGFERVYCVICDAEVNRVWVAENPTTSRIIYLAPCGRAVRRLNEYGIPNERILLTGFPIPLELLGDETLSVLRQDLGQRLHYLDPNERFWPMRLPQHFLGHANCRFRNDRALTITFGVGGAGAQTDIAYEAARSLREMIAKGEIIYNILAGVRPEVVQFLENVKKELALPQIRIIYGHGLEEYFQGFTRCMRTTDILWTKPSELSFYCGLGIPVIFAPHIGAQEYFNKEWLLEIQAGFPQQDPQYTHQWLLDLVKAGRLADAGWNGFLKARKYGTYKIHEILKTGTMTQEKPVLRR